MEKRRPERLNPLDEVLGLGLGPRAPAVGDAAPELVQAVSVDPGQPGDGEMETADPTDGDGEMVTSILIPGATPGGLLASLSASSAHANSTWGLRAGIELIGATAGL